MTHRTSSRSALRSYPRTMRSTPSSSGWTLRSPKNPAMSDASRNFEIVPAILTDDPAELDRLLGAFKAAGSSRVHLDVIDGSLVPGKTPTGHRELRGRDVGMALDVHLMVNRPDEHLVGWEGVPNI